MKTYKAYFVWMIMAGCMALGVWGCQSNYLVPPLVVPTPTSTPTLVPGCGVSIVSYGSLYVSLGTATATPVPVTTPIPVPTPVFTPYPSPVPYPVTGVIRDLAGWQGLHGTATPPVDFSRQMLVPVEVMFGCSGSTEIVNACWDDSKVTIFMTAQYPPPFGPMCNVAAQFLTELVAVPQCNLPVYTERVGYTYW